jgi:phosphatidylserine/phosphatidylglycerophosphate/cardiolipin synthase-like enzyme
MKRFPTLVVSALLLLQACQPIPATSNPRGQVPAAILPSPASSPNSVDSPNEISMPVGYGFDGGWYQLYFTNPADPAADQLNGGPDNAVVAAIEGAQLSVDAALYSLTLNSVRQALLHAHRRGVQVRIVMESDNMDAFDPQALKDAGIPMVGDRRQGLMHNKFVIIDQSEVWTGSMNLTDAGTYRDRNNLMRIRSQKLAADFETEFEEMFVDDRFGKEPGMVTPYPNVKVDGTSLDIYFSPDDHVQAALVDLLSNAQSSIDFLAYSFTSDPLSKAIQDRAKAGVAVRGVMDADQIKTNTGTEYDAFRAAGLDVRLDQEPGLMHHKVMIIDQQIVVLGSYNFTASAEKSNDENVVVIHSPEIAARYLDEFRRVYAAAKP